MIDRANPSLAAFKEAIQRVERGEIVAEVLQLGVEMVSMEYQLAKVDAANETHDAEVASLGHQQRPVGVRLRARVLYTDKHGTNREAESAKTNAVVGLPGRPRNFAAQATGLGYHTARLTWDPPTLTGGLPITYQYCQKPASASDTTWSDWIGVDTAQQVDVDGLQSGRSYAFQVRAVRGRRRRRR